MKHKRHEDIKNATSNTKLSQKLSINPIYIPKDEKSETNSKMKLKDYIYQTQMTGNRTLKRKRTNGDLMK